MGDEAKTIARGLQKRDPDLLDRLIEQYQYRLFATCCTSRETRARRRFFPGNVDPRSRARPPNRWQVEIRSLAFAIARHLVIDWQRSKKPQSLDTLTDPERDHPLQLRE